MASGAASRARACSMCGSHMAGLPRGAKPSRK
ncbi:Uncharacterised protein [Bordetella pertussis]|nr:Uncharacterised protein [Bordetella pertussis]